MFKNYFKIAIRQLHKQRMYSIIKIGGFALSIAACLLIALFISNELSYDKSIPGKEYIYRVFASYNDNGTIEKGTSFQPPFAKAIKKDFSEIELSGRLMPNTLFPGAGSNYIRRTDQQENTYEPGFTYADQSILDILQLPMLYGKREHALDRPNTMVISKKKADKYFPNQNPVGRTMFLNDDKNKTYTIAAVMEDFPATSHLQYDYFLTLSGIELWPGEQTGWRSSNYPVYIKLRPGTNVTSFEKKLTDDVLKNYIIPTMKEDGDKDADNEAKKSFLYLQPVTDIHLKSFDINDGLPHGDIRFVWLFGSIAFFILVIASANFINLSTAKSANRAKEVGLRKVVGSYKGSLVKQFLTESLLFSFLSCAIGLLMAILLLPYFNTLAAKSLVIPFNAWWFIPMMIAAASIIGFFAGLYPSFYLASFNPIEVLKGQLSRGSKNSVLRNGLVVFQFTISTILIISTFIIYNQMNYILNKDLGFEKDQVVQVQGTNTLGKEVKNFKSELLKLPDIKSVSISDYLPINESKRNGNTFYNEGKTKEESGVDTQFWIVDVDYIKTMGMKIIKGRNFSSEMVSDSQAVVINQTLANKLNLKDPIGKRITNTGGIFNVVGVVQDFNFESMKDKVGGLCMHLGNSSSIVSVKVGTGDMKNLISSITSVWKKFTPSQPIRYAFMDESFANMYADVQRTGSIFTSFALLAIIIACLGLFALSAFMAEQRSKEIGIRKVLGASTGNITALLSVEFLKLVLIAIVIASPIAWWAMNKWLQDFAYRINISWWVFLFAAMMAVLIALITVSFQSVRAALTNPIKNLRSE